MPGETKKRIAIISSIGLVALFIVLAILFAFRQKLNLSKKDVAEDSKHVEKTENEKEEEAVLIEPELAEEEPEKADGGTGISAEESQNTTGEGHNQKTIRQDGKSEKDRTQQPANSAGGDQNHLSEEQMAEADNDASFSGGTSSSTAPDQNQEEYTEESSTDSTEQNQGSDSVTSPSQPPASDAWSGEY